MTVFLHFLNKYLGCFLVSLATVDSMNIAAFWQNTHESPSLTHILRFFLLFCQGKLLFFLK